MKRLLALILAISMFGACAVLLASCGHKHTYGEWKVTKSPTCSEEGVISQNCECGDVKNQPLDKLEHTYGGWTVEKAATCTEAGTITRKCNCGDTQTDSIEATGHTEGEWIVHKDSTVNTEGEKHLLCASCGEVLQKESIPTKPDETPKLDENGNVLPPDYDFMGNDLSDVVELGQYKDLVIEVAPKIELTEEYFNAEIQKEIILYGQYNEIRSGTVKESDIVKIKYVGYIDGQKFEGGEGTQEYFTIYDGGGFIDGFAKGLIGAPVGVEIEINVTFPEDYHAEEFAGKPAVFKVTVEFIYEAKELTNQLVYELSGGAISTYKEFKKQAWDLMEESIEEEYKTAKLTAVWAKILESSKEIELPAGVLADYYNYNLDYYRQYADYYYMSLEEFLAYIGITLDDIREDSKEEFFYECVLYSIIKAENITITEEDFNKHLKEMMDYNGVDEKTIYEYYTKEELNEMFLCTKGYEAVLEWNIFVDKTPTQTDKI